MKEFSLNTLKDFNEIKRKFYGRGIGFVFRGQADNSFDLTPGISRKKLPYEQLKNLENDLLTEFKKGVQKIERESNNKIISLRDNYETFENQWRWMDQAQHYSLPTRLLDWTFLPEVALFFAIYGKSHIEQPGQFWILEVRDNKYWSFGGERDDHFFTDPNNMNGKRFLLSPGCYLLEENKFTQGGKLTALPLKEVVVPLENHDFFKHRLIKYTIPSNRKHYFQDYLESQGYNYKNLFPLDERVDVKVLVNSIRKQFGFSAII